ncbi:SAM-dependent methyltransferase [Nocardioides sp. R-C-SC26]|uniref:SAM-dependent methyltransferase n=1 Tax=Nocardioides sp. R-C-SC26 TaxID=2870414 RepID=UPI001E36E1A0|nr:SAM-dependent methyltransferase [Nocardioides sp. R-C-SC26]
MIIRVVGFGMGPQHVTPEAAAALRASSYVLAVSKRDDDPLLAVRREVAAAYGLDVVAVEDPARDRDDPADYDGAVRDWHEARSHAWGTAVAGRPGDPAFLVWGDPALYDSTLRVVDRLAARLDADVEVVAGISAPQLLAARHRVVLHEVGHPVHVTTERRLRGDGAGRAAQSRRDAHQRCRVDGPGAVVDLVGGQPRSWLGAAGRRPGRARGRGDRLGSGGRAGRGRLGDGPLPAPRPRPRRAAMTRPDRDVLLCRDCCCGTSKHPTTDHAAQRDAVEASAGEWDGERVRVRVVDCLDECDRSNVVLVRDFTVPGRRPKDVWLGGVLTEAATSALATWVRRGGPVPEALAPLMFRGKRS